MSEIPVERLPQALAARLDCPACSGVGKVRLTLASNGPGDLAVWRCSGCDSEWHEDGKPRWSIELPVEVVFGVPESQSSGRAET